VGENPNGDMIRLARESREMTQGELAEIIGVSQGLLSKIENGLLPAADDVLSRIGRSLNYPQSFFFQQERLFGLPARFHRKLKNVNGKALDRIHADVNIMMIHLDRLRKSVELEDADLIPRIDPDEVEGGAATIARHVRDLWQMPKGPIKDLVEIVEAAGGIIVLADFGNDRMDGLGIVRSSLPPVFFLNRNIPMDRLRFTLAHELGHVIMHRIPTEDTEEEAHEFASELLMPASEIAAVLKPVTLERLATLKLIWKVSIAALLKRAEQLGAINKAQYKYLWGKMGAAGYRVAEPPELELPIEEPRVVTDILQAHLNELGYSPEQLQQLLAIRFPDFRRLYPTIGARVQLVRSEEATGRSSPRYGLGGAN
jgi:Zn-dependent peptidase ImmA (M78 family)/DNA-binding XRE family transcriptional regulator